MKVLHLSTWEEVCGIANYTKNLVNSLEKQGIHNEVYPINKTEQKYWSFEEIRNYFLSFCQVAKEFDIVHIQHEHSFFHGSYPFSKSIDIFHEILLNLKKQNKKVFVTFHTEPTIFFDSLSSLLFVRNRTAISHSFQSLKWKLQITRFFQRINSNYTAIVHNKKSKLAFVKSGFSDSAIQIVTHGIVKRETAYDINSVSEKKLAKEKIKLPEDSKLLSIFGFVSSYKGYQVAIEALNYLPDNYYLGIVGGIHPSANDRTLDSILKTIEDSANPLAVNPTMKNLKNRVLVTGFIELNMLDLFQAATDICLAPYVDWNIAGSGALTWALTSGRPTIASKIPSFWELNEKANCLLLVTPDSPNELAWQIINLMENEILREKLVTNALKYATDHYWDNTTLELIEIYEKAQQK